MNFANILLRSHSRSSKSNAILRSSLAAKQATNKSSVISRRMLFSSQETGGLKVYQNARRVKPVWKVWSAILLVPCSAELYLFFTKEEEINKFLGTNWNTGLVGMVLLLPFIMSLTALIFMPTIPF